MVYKLHIKHSGGCFYSKMFEMIEQEVKKAIPDLDVEEDLVPCISGCFEVQLIKGDKKQLIHSKLNGHGSITKNQLDKFVEKVKAA